MISSPLVLASGACVLIVSAMLIFTDRGLASRHLRERVMATRELKSHSGFTESLIYVPVKQTLLLRVASLLGYQADLPSAYAASPRIVLPLSLLIGFVAFNLGARVVPKLFAITIGVFTALIIARLLFNRKSRVYRAQLFKQIPDTMSLMLRAVRAGLPVAEAIRNVGRESMAPTRDEFARVAGEAALGSPIEIAMRRLADRTGLQEYAFFSVIIGLHGQTGGNLSETLENLADMVRRRVAMAAKGKAMSAEGRLSAAVVGALPFVVGLLTMLTNPGYLDEFVTNPNGPTLIAIFVGLLALGLGSTHFLIKRSTED